MHSRSSTPQIVVQGPQGCDAGHHAGLSHAELHIQRVVLQSLHHDGRVQARCGARQRSQLSPSAGLRVADEVEKGTASWEKLWDKLEYFGTYKYFVYVTCCARSEARARLRNRPDTEQAGHLRFKGLVESTLRFLVYELEEMGDAGVKLVHPYTKAWRRLRSIH